MRPFSFPSSVGAQTFSSTTCSSLFSFPSSVGAFSSTTCSLPFSFPSSVGAQTFGSSISGMCISMSTPSFSIFNPSSTQASGSSSSSSSRSSSSSSSSSMSGPSFSFLSSVDIQASCSGSNSSSSTMSGSPFSFPNSVGAEALGSSSSSSNIESLFDCVGSRPVSRFQSSTLTNKESARTNDYTSTGNTRPSFNFTSTESTGTNDYTSTGNTNQQTPLGEKTEESICLKVAIEKKKNRVVFLECGNDFVDIILSFLTLPIGRILSILQGKSPDAVIGCMTNLYQSLGYLDLKNFNTNACKEMLLRPGTSLGSIWRKLKLKVDETLDADDCRSKSSSEQANNEQDVFVKGGSQSFMITDDLQVLVGSTSLSITLLKRLGIMYPNEIEIQDVVVKHDKLVQLLELSFVSRSPLTHWILSEKDFPGLTKDDDDLKLTETFDKGPQRNGTKITRLVLYIRKSQNSVLYAECGADFVDCIFSFLAFPLGSILKILDCNSQIGGLDSLYESVSSLGSNGHLKSEEARNLLLFPKLSPFYGSDNQLLHIEEISVENKLGASNNLNNVSLDNPKSSTGDRKKRGTYLKGHAKFMVTDDLTITLFSPTRGLTYLAKSNIPITDVDEVSIEFGVKEAKALLKAALTSKTALTDVFFRHRHQTDEGERLLHLEALFLSEID